MGKDLDNDKKIIEDCCYACSEQNNLRQEEIMLFGVYQKHLMSPKEAYYLQMVE